MDELPLRAEQDRGQIGLTANIVAAYVSNHQLPPDDVPRLIREIHTALTTLDQAPRETQAERQLKPAVKVSKSVTEDVIYCLECGQPCKTLKRHLASQHGLTPDEYRARWALPADYPMTAPAYSRLRSDSARRNGLGRAPGGRDGLDGADGLDGSAE